MRIRLRSRAFILTGGTAGFAIGGFLGTILVFGLERADVFTGSTLNGGQKGRKRY
jgi:hypothetical protein